MFVPFFSCLPRSTLVGGVFALHGLLLAGAALEVFAADEPPVEETWGAKFQATYVWQKKRPFDARYTGTNSLTPTLEQSHSFTSTAFLGVRPWRGGELYFNPEIAAGIPLSGLTGLGGFSNGEITRSSGPNPKLYRARFFLRQTWGFGGGREAVESDQNQLAGSVDRRRLVLTAGNLAVLDLFDDNTYAHDPRTNFLNWGLMTHAAFDYAADSRGYSRGMALEYYHDAWAIRAGRFIQPARPNQLTLDPNIFRIYGDQAEIEHAHTLGGKPGKLRLLVFNNRAKMVAFTDASRLGVDITDPLVESVRRVQDKWGIGLNVEQAVSSSIGIFARAAIADGRTETYAFTEADRSLAIGAVVKGTAWKRAEDTVGIALLRNGLSSDRRNFLAAGNLSFFIGDGALAYRSEQILETYYSFGVSKGNWVTLDFQRIRNPAYNADRGPVDIWSLRLHAEF